MKLTIIEHIIIKYKNMFVIYSHKGIKNVCLHLISSAIYIYIGVFSIMPLFSKTNYQNKFKVVFRNYSCVIICIDFHSFFCYTFFKTFAPSSLHRGTWALVSTVCVLFFFLSPTLNVFVTSSFFFFLIESL